MYKGSYLKDTDNWYLSRFYNYLKNKGYFLHLCYNIDFRKIPSINFESIEEAEAWIKHELNNHIHITQAEFRFHQKPLIKDVSNEDLQEYIDSLTPMEVEEFISRLQICYKDIS